MKTCSRCNQNKSLNEFNKNIAKKDGVQSYCRPCSRDNNNHEYINNPKRKEAIYARNNQIQAFNRKFTTRYKRFCGCRICGEKEPVVLDFHHLGHDHKDDSVSSLTRYSLSRVKNEIKKCIVLCANCHRKLHAGLIEFKSCSRGHS